jgi:hypothetical protein
VAVAAAMAVAIVVVAAVAAMAAVMTVAIVVVRVTCVASQAPDWGSDDSRSLGRDDGGAARGHTGDKCRKDGMHSMFEVHMVRGGCWYFSKESAVAEILKVLIVRQEVCAKHNINEGQIIPRTTQDEIKSVLLIDWKANQEEKIQEVHTRRGGVCHKMTRDIRSYYRTWCYDTYGGQEWLWIIIATGGMNDDLLDCMNESMKNKKDLIHERVAAGEIKWHESSASSRDRTGAVKGSQHQKSAPKVLRENAKRLQTKVNKVHEQRMAGMSRVSPYQYDLMAREMQTAWDLADAASWKAGVEFTDQKGDRQLVKADESIVGVAMMAYEKMVAAGVIGKARAATAAASSRGTTASASSRG